MKKVTPVILALAAAVCGFFSLGCMGDETPGVESVSLSETTRTLDAEEEFLLTATCSPAEAEPCEFDWFSSNEEIACVEGGKVTGRARGTATITVRARTGNLSAECVVTVSDTAKFKTVCPGESINEAIASVPENNESYITIKLMSGTYVEDVVVNRPFVRLSGANAGLDNANAARKAESVVLPATVRLPASDLNEDRQNIGVIAVDADNVTIDGISVNGDNPELDSDVATLFKGRVQAGKNTDAFYGIFQRVKKLSYNNDYRIMVQGLSVKNCVIENVYHAAVSFSAKNSLSSSGGNEVCGNRIQNVYSTSGGYGVELDKNVFAKISKNVIENVQTGVSVGVLNLTGDAGACVSENEIFTRGNGVVLSRITSDSGYDVKDNRIKSDAGFFGIAYLSCTKDTFHNMFASGNIIEGFVYGVHVYNSNRSISVIGGEIRDCRQGLYVTDSGVTSDSGMVMTLVDVLNVSCEQTLFEECETAVHVFSDKRRNNSMIVKGGNIRNCDTGLMAEVASGASAIINVVAEVNYDNVGSPEVALGSGKINRQ